MDTEKHGESSNRTGIGNEYWTRHLGHVVATSHPGIHRASVTLKGAENRQKPQD
jgi:hypothetical protein